MNIAPTYTPSQIALHEAAKARAHRKMMAARLLRLQANENAPLAVTEQKEPEKPVKVELDHNHHVQEWRKWLVREKTAPIRNYIKMRAEAFGLTYDEVVSGSRKKRIVGPKHQIMWEIKRKVRPETSYPEIAKNFGLVDHTTAIYVVAKMDKIMGWNDG